MIEFSISGFLLIFFAVLSTWAFSRSIRTASWAQFVLVGWLVFTVLILVTSEILSALSILGNPAAWVLAFAILSLLGAAVLWKTRPERMPSLRAEARDWWGCSHGLWHQWFARIAIVWVALLVLIQLITVLRLAPSHWDSMTYILPRTLLFIQAGSLERFFTLDYAQAVHVDGLARQQIFWFWVLGRGEGSFAIPSVLSLGLGALAVAEAARLLFDSRLAGVFAALIVASATNCLLTASTAQSDLPIAAFLAVSIAFGILAIRTASLLAVVMAAIAASCALTLKASAILALVSLMPLLGFAWWVWAKRNDFRAPVWLASFSLLVLVLCIVLPTGYAHNAVEDGHPLGAKWWRDEHELRPANTTERFEQGMKNAARFAISFVGLDGFYGGSRDHRNPAHHLQIGFQGAIHLILNRIGVDLTSPEHTRVPFEFAKRSRHEPKSHEDLSYSGITFLLAFLASIFVLNLRKQPQFIPLALIFAAVIFLILQSFTAQFDPWRGRSFTNLVVFLAPLTGVLLVGSSRRRLLIAGLIVAGTIFQSGSTVLFRQTTPIIPHRLDQSTILKPGSRSNQIVRFASQIAPEESRMLRDGIDEFDRLVPKNAELGLVVPSGQIIYPFFGPDRKMTYFQSVKDARESGLVYVLFHEKMQESEENYRDLSFGFRLWINEKDISPGPQLDPSSDAIISEHSP